MILAEQNILVFSPVPKRANKSYEKFEYSITLCTLPISYTKPLVAFLTILHMQRKPRRIENDVLMLPKMFNPKQSFFKLKIYIFFQKADLHGEGKISVDDYFEILTANNIK
jgi:hypothetical protein